MRVHWTVISHTTTYDPSDTLTVDIIEVEPPRRCLSPTFCYVHVRLPFPTPLRLGLLCACRGYWLMKLFVFSLGEFVLGEKNFPFIRSLPQLFPTTGWWRCLDYARLSSSSFATAQLYQRTKRIGADRPDRFPPTDRIQPFRITCNFHDARETHPMDPALMQPGFNVPSATTSSVHVVGCTVMFFQTSPRFFRMLPQHGGTVKPSVGWPSKSHVPAGQPNARA